MSTTAQIAANQKNAKHSTGPQTPNGRSAAAQNNFRHGLRGHFTVLPNENAEEFTTLLDALLEEHEPATVTEQILVGRMAQHEWLSRRAQALIDEATLDIATTDKTTEPAKALSLWLRYQTTHDRGFHKCLADLLKLRNEKRKDHIGFERQKHEGAENDRKQQVAGARARALHAQAALKEFDVEIRSELEAPLPGNTAIKFEKIKPFLNLALESYFQAQAKAAVL